jgi:hypothetical protein
MPCQLHEVAMRCHIASLLHEVSACAMPITSYVLRRSRDRSILVLDAHSSWMCDFVKNAASLHRLYK